MKSLKSANVKLPSSISPMAKWIVTIVILGIGVVLVVFLYAQEQSRNSQLKDQVNAASGTLVQNGLNKQGLEKRLIAANLGLVDLSAQFPSEKQSMDVEEALFSAAADSGVTVTNIGCPDPRGQQVGSNTYKAFAASVDVTGTTEDLLRFVGRLGFWLPSAGIDSVSMGEGNMTVTLTVYALGS
jgi:Tfp pilus assembly protein PilO